MSTILVTGASGFIAKNIVRELLEKGYKVKATVRSERRKAEIEKLFPGQHIEYVLLDLNSDEGWAEAMKGVDVLMHTASPFPGAEPKNRDELIRPAVDGTLRALRAAKAAGVTRVILTSSVAAIYKPSGEDSTTRVKTRADWTDPNGPNTTVYEASKTLAEHAAWDFVADNPEMRLTVMNPGLVLGPAMDERFGTSLETVEQILNRDYPAFPNMQFPIVDVRDVARAHVAAIADEDSVGQRFPLNAGAMWFPEIAKVLADKYPGERIPTCAAPNWVITLLSYFDPYIKTAAMSVRSGITDIESMDAPRQFGFTYIPSRDAVIASAEFLRSIKK